MYGRFTGATGRASLLPRERVETPNRPYLRMLARTYYTQTRPPVYSPCIMRSSAFLFFLMMYVRIETTK